MNIHACPGDPPSPARRSRSRRRSRRSRTGAAPWPSWQQPAAAVGCETHCAQFPAPGGWRTRLDTQSCVLWARKRRQTRHARARRVRRGVATVTAADGWCQAGAQRVCWPPVRAFTPARVTASVAACPSCVTRRLSRLAATPAQGWRHTQGGPADRAGRAGGRDGGRRTAAAAFLPPACLAPAIVSVWWCVRRRAETVLTCDRTMTCGARSSAFQSNPIRLLAVYELLPGGLLLHPGLHERR